MLKEPGVLALCENIAKRYIQHYTPEHVATRNLEEL
jgi:hypothetical protein